MKSSLPWHYKSLHEYQEYIASEHFSQYGHWQELAGRSAGHVYIENDENTLGENREAVVIMVGRVSESRLFVHGQGAWSEKFGTDFAKAKFQLTLLTP